MRKVFTMLAALAGSLLIPAAAHAADGFVTGDVNMRAGPGTDYPRITVLPEGAPINIYGCLAGYSWCDVGAYGDRGWVSTRYISIFYDGPNYVYRPRYVVPSVTFSFGYWDRWYSDRPWYRTYRRPPSEERIYRPPVYRNDPPVERMPGRNERIFREPIFRNDDGGGERIVRQRPERNGNLERYVDPDGSRNERMDRILRQRGGGDECRPGDPRCAPIWRNERGGEDSGGGGRNR